MPPIGGILWSEPLEGRLRAGLVVGDHEPTVAGRVDTIDEALELDAPTVGQVDADVVVATEPHLGSEDPSAPGDDDVAVDGEPLQEVGEHPGTFVGPERRPSVAAAAFVAFADLVERCDQRRPMLVGPAGQGRLGEALVDHGLVQQVEGVMLRGALVAGGDRDLVARLLDGAHLEEVLREVGVRALDPRLQSSR